MTQIPSDDPIPPLHTQAQIETLTDSAIIEICRERRWENRVKMLGCLSIPVISIIVSIILAKSGWLPPLEAVVLGIALSCGLFWAMLWLSDLRLRRYRAELAKRYGMGPLSYYIKRASTRLKAPDAPEWILLLQGRGLMRGGRCYIEASILERGDKLSLLTCITTQSLLAIMMRDGSAYEVRSFDLPAVQANELKLLCARLRLEKWQDASPGDKDGFPCTVVVLNREHEGIGLGKCNLAGIPFLNPHAMWLTYIPRETRNQRINSISQPAFLVAELLWRVALPNPRKSPVYTQKTIRY